MKNTIFYVKEEMLLEKQADSDRPIPESKKMSSRQKNKNKNDIWAHNFPEEQGLGFKPDNSSINDTDFPPLTTPEIEGTIKNFYNSHPELNADKNSWINTFTGKKFFPLSPRVEDICIEDIAHALSNMCRFTGHCRSFYSVAQHSVLVSYICDKENSFYGLMHDQEEAYLGDISRPLKRTSVFQPYRDYEKKLHEVMCMKFGLSITEPHDVKWADTKLLATEARDLLVSIHSEWKFPTSPLPFKIEPLPPQEAKKLFMERFKELTNNSPI